MRALRLWVPLLPLVLLGSGALTGCAATVGPQFPQEIAASFAQQPMRKLETKNAEIYYPEGKRETAERVAARLGQCVDDLRALSRSRDDVGRKVLVFLTTADFNNAYVSPQVAGNREHMVVPENFSIELFNLFDLGLTDVGDVGCHEAVHYVQLDQTTGFWGVINRLTGGVISPNSFTESWFLEGLATFYEGRLGRAVGRPHSPLWNGLYEAGIAYRGGEVRTGDLSPENRELLPFGGNYVAGEYFVDFLADRYGEQKLWELVATQGDSIFSPFGVTLRFKAVYGKTIGALYDEYQEEARRQFALRKRPAEQRVLAENVGYFTRLAGSPADGATATVSSQREEVAQLVVRERDGKVRFARSLTEFIPPRRWVLWSTTLVSGMSFSQDGKKLFLVDADLDVDAEFQTRLFEIDARTGQVLKVYDDFGRGMGGSVHPDGSRYVFVQLEADASHLATLELASGKVTRLMSFEGGRSLGAPAYSPDGRRVLFPRRTERGFDLYVLDVDGGGKPRALTHDGRFNYSPRWLDDQTAIFIREHDDHAQVHSVDVTSGEISRVSEAPFVAFDPAPIGNGELAFLNREGWDWSLDVIPVKARAAEATLVPAGPELASLQAAPPGAQADAALAPVEVLSDNPYSHTDHLFVPLFRLPFAYVLPNEAGRWTELYVSLALSGRDRLGFHNWGLNLGYDNVSNEPSVSFAYGNTQLAPWYLELNLQRLIGSGRLVSDGTHVRIQENVARITATRSFWTTPVGFGFEYVSRAESAPGVLDRWIRLIGPTIATSYFSGEGTPYAGTRRGIGLDASAAYFPRQLGSGSDLGAITLGDLRAEVFGFLPLPGLSRQSFRLRLAGRTLPGAPPGLLQVGGFTPAAVLGTYNSRQPAPEGPDYFLPSGFEFIEPVRGYEDAPVFTTQAAVAGMRWRVPWIFDRGTTSTLYLLPSFFLSQIDFELFAEGALTARLVDDQANPLDAPRRFGAAGGAVFVRTTLGGVLPLSVGYQFSLRSTLRPAHFWLLALE